MKSLPSSLILKFLFGHQIPRKTKKKAYLKSWLREINQDAKVALDLTQSSWLKQPTTSLPVSNSVNPHLKRIQAKTVSCKATNCMRMYGEKKAMLLHYL